MSLPTRALTLRCRREAQASKGPPGIARAWEDPSRPLRGTSGGIGLPAWAGLGYVSVFSMPVGFVFWYRGLARGGIAGVGQLQLLQPFLGLALAGLVLHEPVEGGMIACAAGVVLCVAAAKRFA